ncbi:MarR family winged helix-turn-helix transcriptional regulator [Wenyingzhuangia sp. 2_MG-2023]|uniref:MarR family winged helix-turn-helix transcriptional regulator n=1 Tax=Wenyingzhuangia sp. 2_MG-2023 TaxID=3062639 RepID=UPI0026E1DB5D|nr:MarR family transcriptional regulator [Wenyingzhuangia sp. 2_MG-2023]MDO6736935.1 MarR family transcriptional regulator [Wenyingzhuangia sp. 2_MG-2023]MDO6801895.1 MarR family transcriptional regulator [Wenyingzhuangia sp. 1_MG-2023]
MNDLNSRAVINLMIGGNFMAENMNAFFKIYDLTVQQYNILRILRGQDGLAINLFELQKHMIHKMSNTTRLVDKLKIKGLLERKVCEENRRKIEIFITDKGLGLLAGIDQYLIDYEKKLTKSFTKEELIQLNTLLEKIK